MTWTRGAALWLLAACLGCGSLDASAGEAELPPDVAKLRPLDRRAVLAFGALPLSAAARMLSDFSGLEIRASASVGGRPVEWPRDQLTIGEALRKALSQAQCEARLVGGRILLGLAAELAAAARDPASFQEWTPSPVWTPVYDPRRGQLFEIEGQRYTADEVRVKFPDIWQNIAGAVPALEAPEERVRPGGQDRWLRDLRTRHPDLWREMQEKGADRKVIEALAAARDKAAATAKRGKEGRCEEKEK